MLKNRIAEGQPVELIDGARLVGMLGGVEIKKETASYSQEPKTAHRPSPPEAFMPPPARKTCPKCGSEMVERVARRGPNAGNKFLGCSNFPKCRHTATTV